MNDLFSRFLFLQQTFPRPLRGQRSSKGPAPAARLAAEVELFHLAQAIASQWLPELQAQLTAARSEAMQYLVQSQHTSMQQVSISLPLHIRLFKWEEVQITPEVANDMTITGRTVPLTVTKRLTALHRQQITALKDLLAKLGDKGATHV